MLVGHRNVYVGWAQQERTCVPSCLYSGYVYVGWAQEPTCVLRCLYSGYVYVGWAQELTCVPSCLYSGYVYVGWAQELTCVPSCLYSGYVYVGWAQELTCVPSCLYSGYVYVGWAQERVFQVVLDLIPSKCIVVLGQLTCCLSVKFSSSVIRGMVVIQVSANLVHCSFSLNKQLFPILYVVATHCYATAHE